MNVVTRGRLFEWRVQLAYWRLIIAPNKRCVGMVPTLSRALPKIRPGGAGSVVKPLTGRAGRSAGVRAATAKHPTTSFRSCAMLRQLLRLAMLVVAALVVQAAVEGTPPRRGGGVIRGSRVEAATGATPTR